MVEDGVDFADEGELVGLLLFWGSENLSACDDFVEKGVDQEFLVGGPCGVVKADTGDPLVVDANGTCGHVDSASLALCVFDKSADGFFGSEANGIIRVMLTEVVVLSDHVDGAGSDGFDDAHHFDSLVDASGVFLELFIVEVFGGDKESECARDDVVGVDVAVDVFGGEFVGGEAGGRHAGCESESSSCCC